MANEHPHGSDEQDLWLAQASKNVRRCAFYMRKAIDEDNMQEALRHSAALLGELRTSLLGPQKYYELYMLANDELRSLEPYFLEEKSKGRSFSQLYELVQHAGNVVPRLYLLFTVGACFIRSKEAPAKPILSDLADMCKGVQHPTRGLFLRAYLVQVCRSLLPDTGSVYEGGEGGDVVDALEFLISNFTEMNKLWVRMKMQGGSFRREQLDKERAQLADLVGKNLTQISQLEGLTFELYRDVALPRVLEQVVACKDELAQGYLMQCIAAVFPDDFHVGTLEMLLDVLPVLQPGVKLASVMGSLLERLASYAMKDPDVITQLDATGAFTKMSQAVSKSLQEHPTMPASDLAAMYAGLISFSSAVYASKVENIDNVLLMCYQALAPRGQISDQRAERQVISLLSFPLQRYDMNTVLAFKNYSPVISLLPPLRQRDMSRKIIDTVIDSGHMLGDVEKVEMLFGTLIKPAVIGVEDAQLDDERIKYTPIITMMLQDIQDDAQYVARLIHCLHNDNPDTQYRILETVLHKVLPGGPARCRPVLAPLCFSALQAVSGALSIDSAAASSTEKATKWYKFIHKAASALADCRAPDLALRIFLAAALSASEELRSEMIAYECFERAFVIFEEDIPDSNQELRALQSIIGTLCECRAFEGDNGQALLHKATSYCSKLLKRKDQCLLLIACAHLYWQKERNEAGAVEEKVALGDTHGTTASTLLQAKPKPLRRDAKGVLSCLKRALKTAHTAQQQLALVERKSEDATVPGHLFVEILNGYLYFFDRGVETITAESVQSVMELTGVELSSDACKGDEGLQAYYKRTLDRAREQKERWCIEGFKAIQ